jgi:cation diffusion facilitator family transporter
MTEKRYTLGKRVAVVGIIVNVVLTLFKLLAGFMANSAAMIADAIHSASDILATSVVAISFNVAQKPEDQEHPYGHEKAESIAAKLVAGLLLIAGLVIGWEALKTLIHGDIQKPGIIALYAAIVSIITKEGLFWYTITAANKINSTALKADAWHHRSDAFSSIGTLIGIGAARLGYPIADPIAAILVSLLILKVAYDIYAKSIRELMDSSAPRSQIQALHQTILSIENVKGIDSLKTRIHGNMIYIDVDIVVDRSISVSAGHEIANKVRDTVKSKFTDVKDIMVHVNPSSPISQTSCKKCSQRCNGQQE